VLATSAPALFDGDMQQKGVGQLADVFGADFDRFLGRSAIDGNPTGIAASAGAATSRYSRDRREINAHTHTLGVVYCTFKPRKRAQIQEKFTTGDPALITNSAGKGTAIIMGYPLGVESFVSAPYHLHHGRGAAGRPDGNPFIQGALRWAELFLPKLGIERKAVVTFEYAPRGPIAWHWTRKDCGYRDYEWEFNYAPRSIELSLRRREGNPNIYLTVFNREGGAGGDDPGVIHFEATSKEINIELMVGDVRQVYDISLGCPVPFTQRRSRDGKALGSATFPSMIETSSARMFAIATEDDTIRKYAGNREQGLSDAALRRAVAKHAEADPPADSVVIGREKILDFLSDQGPKGIIISAESPVYIPAAKRLAAAFEQVYGKKARVTRVSPRVSMPHNIFIDRPHVFLGNHAESHYIAFQRMYWAHYWYAARLPVMTSHTFPGSTRSVVMLMRPYMRRRAQGDRETTGRVMTEEPAPPELVIGASTAEGLDAGVQRVINMIR